MSSHKRLHVDDRSKQSDVGPFDDRHVQRGRGRVVAEELKQWAQCDKCYKWRITSEDWKSSKFFCSTIRKSCRMQEDQADEDEEVIVAPEESSRPKKTACKTPKLLTKARTRRRENNTQHGKKKRKAKAGRTPTAKRALAEFESGVNDRTIRAKGLYQTFSAVVLAAHRREIYSTEKLKLFWVALLNVVEAFPASGSETLQQFPQSHPHAEDISIARGAAQRISRSCKYASSQQGGSGREMTLLDIAEGVIREVTGVDWKEGRKRRKTSPTPATTAHAPTNPTAESEHVAASNAREFSDGALKTRDSAQAKQEQEQASTRITLARGLDPSSRPTASQNLSVKQLCRWQKKHQKLWEAEREKQLLAEWTRHPFTYTARDRRPLAPSSVLCALSEDEKTQVRVAIDSGDPDTISRVAEMLCPGVMGLSLKQPWAEAVLRSVKDVENRSTNLKLACPGSVRWLALHSSAKPHDQYALILAKLRQMNPEAFQIPLEEEYGKLLAVIRIARVDRPTKEFCGQWGFPNYFHWHVDAVLKLRKPIAIKGKPGLRKLPDEVHLLMALLTREKSSELDLDKLEAMAEASIQRHEEAEQEATRKRNAGLKQAHTLPPTTDKLDTGMIKSVQAMPSVGTWFAPPSAWRNGDVEMGCMGDKEKKKIKKAEKKEGNGGRGRGKRPPGSGSKRLGASTSASSRGVLNYKRKQHPTRTSSSLVEREPLSRFSSSSSGVSGLFSRIPNAKTPSIPWHDILHHHPYRSALVQHPATGHAALASSVCRSACADGQCVGAAACGVTARQDDVETDAKEGRVMPIGSQNAGVEDETASSVPKSATSDAGAILSTTAKVAGCIKLECEPRDGTSAQTACSHLAAMRSATAAPSIPSKHALLEKHDRVPEPWQWQSSSSFSLLQQLAPTAPVHVPSHFSDLALDSAPTPVSRPLSSPHQLPSPHPHQGAWTETLKTLKEMRKTHALPPTELAARTTALKALQTSMMSAPVSALQAMPKAGTKGEYPPVYPPASVCGSPGNEGE